MSRESLIKSADNIIQSSPLIAQSLEGLAEVMANDLNSRMINKTNLDELIGENNIPLMVTNHDKFFAYFNSLISLYDPITFIETIIWALRSYISKGFVPAYWQTMIPEATKVVQKHLPEDQFRQVRNVYDWFQNNILELVRVSENTTSFYEKVGTLNGILEDKNPPSGTRLLAQNYLTLLLEGQRAEAITTIVRNVKSGLPLKEVYLDVLQPAMYEVGRLWQTGKIDIATGHYITASTQLAMAHLFPHAITEKRVGKVMLGSSLGGELHELGLRMVCDFFEYEGWNTYFMGAISSDQSFINAIKEKRPDIVCLSVTMQVGVPHTRDLIKALRTQLASDCPKIIVGGLAFTINPKLAQIVGADAIGTNAQETIERATAIVTS